MSCGRAKWCAFGKIAALEAAERLARPALNVDFDELLDKAEHNASQA